MSKHQSKIAREDQLARREHVINRDRHAQAIARQVDSKECDPRALAAAVADRYFAALEEDLPMDTAPDDIDLVYLASFIQDAIEHKRQAAGLATDTQDSALRAGYVLGVQIGLRMAGGAR
jgi:hypothetical protein